MFIDNVSLTLSSGKGGPGCVSFRREKHVIQGGPDGKDKKVITFKKRRRKDSKVKRGFRRQYTRVKVVSIKA